MVAHGDLDDTAHRGLGPRHHASARDEPKEDPGVEANKELLDQAAQVLEKQKEEGSSRNVKLFLDTANLDEIREGARWGVLRGVTTNPTLIAKENSDFLPLVKEICSIVEGDVSVETTSNDQDLLVRQGREIVQIADNAS